MLVRQDMSKIRKGIAKMESRSSALAEKGNNINQVRKETGRFNLFLKYKISALTDISIVLFQCPSHGPRSPVLLPF